MNLIFCECEKVCGFNKMITKSKKCEFDTCSQIDINFMNSKKEIKKKKEKKNKPGKSNKTWPKNKPGKSNKENSVEIT